MQKKRICFIIGLILLGVSILILALGLNYILGNEDNLTLILQLFIITPVLVVVSGPIYLISLLFFIVSRKSCIKFIRLTSRGLLIVQLILLIIIIIAILTIRP